MNKRQSIIEDTMELLVWLMGINDIMSEYLKNFGVELPLAIESIYTTPERLEKTVKEEIPEHEEKLYYLNSKMADICQTIDKTAKANKEAFNQALKDTGWNCSSFMYVVKETVKAEKSKERALEKGTQITKHYFEKIYHGAKCNFAGDDF